jgi:alpha-galactosidase
MLAATPPMGFNTWNTFGENINEDMVKEVADVMVAEGLRGLGYEYLVIDDCWAERERNSEGLMVPSREKFPGGMKELAAYVHSKGLKFGMYSCSGRMTCAEYPGSYDHEEVDAKTFASWDVDFLKYDYCYLPEGVDGPGLYKKMGAALRQAGKETGREILFSLCEWGTNKPWEWAAPIGGHMWRTTGDIVDSWQSIADIGFSQSGHAKYAGPGHWNDPDMLVVGMYSKGNVARGGCSDTEYRTHFGLWCLLASPLMIGCDPRNMNDVTREILKNEELIAVNQDPLGNQGFRVARDGKLEVWKKPLEGNSLAVGLFNLGDETAKVTATWEKLGLGEACPCTVRDLWTHEDLGDFKGSFEAEVESHGSAIVRVTPA